MHPRDAWPLALALALSALAGCSDPSPPPPVVNDAGDPDVAKLDSGVTGAPPVDAGPPRIAGRRCAAPTAWATPIADYIAVGERVAPRGRFLRGVQDLAVFDGRLFFGYGDANINLGRETPIELRAFADEGAPSATAEFRTDEEQVEQYRALDGDLWVAGVDATEDAWLGNVYRRAGGAWAKLRTVQNGVHVHDVAWWRGALWAVGSGGTPEEWSAGDIYGHLWRSADRGASFTVAARHHNMGAGDARWVRILPLSDAMLLFGYRSDASGRSAIVNVRFDGTSTAPLEMTDPLRASFIVETLPLPGGGGFARGAVNGGSGLIHRGYRVDAGGRATAIDALAGRAILDAALTEAGEVLVLSADADEWGSERPVWSLRLDVTADLTAFTEVARWEESDAVRAVAYWRGAVYLGRDDGAVLRCVLE